MTRVVMPMLVTPVVGNPQSAPRALGCRRASGNTPPEEVQGTSSSREIIVLHENLSNRSP
eukprot:COSAG02_NODE_4_length_69935_cov_46.806590_4_plen_60_part_00